MDETVKNDWQRIRGIFEDVLLRPVEERRPYAEKLCGKDEILWNEVRSLLDWHESSESFLEIPAVVQVVENDQTNNQLIAGQRLLHYEIRELIGMGGMGEVYLARDTRLHRNVAIKLLRKDLLPHIRTNERLLREARAAALLEHPNICQIHEISEVDGFSFIVMQYVLGTTLDEILSGDGVGSAAALDIARQVADGLAEAHRQGIVHRDIKPANIIVSDKGQVKILDFGLAKFIEAETGGDGAGRMESTGGVMGTVPYMSPEQLLGEPVDAKTDVFSFGALLFEMLSGVSAFGRERNAETIAAILNEEPDWSLVSPIFLPLLQRCLAKNQINRYPSACKLSEALAGTKGTVLTTNPVRPKAVYTARALAATEPLDINTAPTIAIPGAKHGATPSTVNATRKESLSPRARRAILVCVLAALALSATVFGYLYTRDISHEISHEISNENKNSEGATQHVYWELADTDKREFIRNRVRHIQTLISDDQRAIDDESLEGIVQEVDWYVSRRDSLSQEPFSEGLRFIYGRATQYVPFVAYEFEKANVPAAIGIYQAMLESEYRDCLVSDNGPVGLFQFTRRTAVRYGLRHDDLCKVDKQSSAAAHYMSDLSRELGSDNSSWTLSLLGFQQGEEGTREQLEQLHNLGVTEQNYWAITENRGRLEPYLESSDIYIRKFFAAAIIGETPERFGLVTPPLSTIRTQTTRAVPNLERLIAIPGGTFMMGRDEGNEIEKPAHEETVKPFRMDKTEVTNAEYYEFVKATHYRPDSGEKFLSHWKNGRPVKGEENMPVRYVNIDDINAFARWRWDRDGIPYRLPTEQEWEFAARNGTEGNLYPWGDRFDPRCAFVDQNRDDPSPVGAHTCGNYWGVVDLVGNVFEWTSSVAWLYPNSKGYAVLPTDEPRYMIRGGSATTKSTGTDAVSSTWRFDLPASKRHAAVGFRLVAGQ